MGESRRARAARRSASPSDAPSAASPVAVSSAVGVEPVGDDQQARRVPVERPRLVVDQRREAGRPGAARALEPELGPAQRLGSSATTRARGRRASPPASDRAKTSRPEPLPPHRQRARRPPGIGDRRVAGLGRSPSGRTAGQAPAFWPAVAARRTLGRRRPAPRRSGRPSRSTRMRSVAGGTGKTAVGSPAAAQTTG